jgi:hypothetical protein
MKITNTDVFTVVKTDTVNIGISTAQSCRSTANFRDYHIVLNLRTEIYPEDWGNMSLRNFRKDSRNCSRCHAQRQKPVESTLLSAKVLNGRARLGSHNYRLVVSCVRAKGDEPEVLVTSRRVVSVSDGHGSRSCIQVVTGSLTQFRTWQLYKATHKLVD